MLVKEKEFEMAVMKDYMWDICEAVMMAKMKDKNLVVTMAKTKDKRLAEKTACKKAD